MASDGFKPCPGCGASAYWTPSGAGPGVVIRCSRCSFRVVSDHGIEAAAEEWNRRVHDDLRPEDGSIAALRDRADDNGRTAKELMDRLRLIGDIAQDGLHMTWLLGECLPAGFSRTPLVGAAFDDRDHPIHWGESQLSKPGCPGGGLFFIFAHGEKVAEVWDQPAADQMVASLRLTGFRPQPAGPAGDGAHIDGQRDGAPLDAAADRPARPAS